VDGMVVEYDHGWTEKKEIISEEREGWVKEKRYDDLDGA